MKQKVKKCLKVLTTHQTGPKGKQVNQVYVEEASDIKSEFYLSCLVDRSSSKIAFISSSEGGMDIEKVARDTPDKIFTTKIDLKDKLDKTEIEKILKTFNFNDKQKIEGENILQAIYKILKEKDANLIEINPLIVTKNNQTKLGR